MYTVNFQLLFLFIVLCCDCGYNFTDVCFYNRVKHLLKSYIYAYKTTAKKKVQQKVAY